MLDPVAAVPHTVIVPARNEAAAIACLLRAIGADRPTPHRQVLVVCNACTDDTAKKAQAVAPTAEVLDLAEPGKGRAINAGLAAARHGIVMVLDADVTISGAALDALAAALAGEGVWAASPAVAFDLAGCDAWVRRYFRVFARHPYLQSGVGGAGVYGLSAAGRTALGPLPPVASDDGLVRSWIPPERQRRIVRDAAGRLVVSRVRPPRSLRQLLRAEARWRRGDRELAALGLTPPPCSLALRGLLRRREIALADAAVYVLVKLAGRLLAAWTGKGGKGSWLPARA